MIEVHDALAIDNSYSFWSPACEGNVLWLRSVSLSLCVFYRSKRGSLLSEIRLREYSALSNSEIFLRLISI